MKDGGLVLNVGLGAMCEEEHIEWAAEDDEGIRDDVTRGPLNAELLRKARHGEIEYMERLKVYELVPVEQCYLDTGRRPMST